MYRVGSSGQTVSKRMFERIPPLWRWEALIRWEVDDIDAAETAAYRALLEHQAACSNREFFRGRLSKLVRKLDRVIPRRGLGRSVPRSQPESSTWQEQIEIVRQQPVEAKDRCRSLHLPGQLESTRKRLRKVLFSRDGGTFSVGTAPTQGLAFKAVKLAKKTELIYREVIAFLEQCLEDVERLKRKLEALENSPQSESLDSD